MKKMFSIFLVLFLFIGCVDHSARNKTQISSQEPVKDKNIDDEKNYVGSCKKLDQHNQAVKGPLCLQELYFDANIKNRIDNIKDFYVESSKIKDKTRIKPDFLGVSMFFYKAKLGNNYVFLKASHTADLNWIIKRWQYPTNSEKYHAQFLNEIYWTKKLSDAGLGPHFYGVTFMNISETIGKKSIREPSLILITSFINGKTYKVASGLIPAYASGEHKKAIEAIVPKLEEFLNENNVQPMDLQYMVDENKKVYVIDPEQWLTI